MAEYMKVESAIGLDNVAPTMEKKTEWKDKESIRNALKGDLGEEFSNLPSGEQDRIVDIVTGEAANIAKTLHDNVGKNKAEVVFGNADQTLRTLVGKYNAEMTGAIKNLQGSVATEISGLHKSLQDIQAKAKGENGRAADLRLKDRIGS